MTSTSTETSERWRRAAARFTEAVESVPADRWESPAPPEGWVARDVVRHVVEWMPGLVLGSAGIPFGPVPSVDDDPVAAWRVVAEALQGALDDPGLSAREFDSQAGHLRVDDAIGMLCLGDIVVHTWDLARAAGLDERLDPNEVHRLYEGMLPLDDLLRSSGQYGPRVEVPDDADEQTKLIAFTGRRP
jgi:uncharacterized protein (TIGR03086 family)